MKTKKILLLTLFLFIFYSLNTLQYKHRIVKKEFKPLTIENIRQELKKLGVKHSNIVIKQVKLETGNLKHVRHNNLFGFRGNNGYLKFKTWQDAIKYKKAWQDKKYHSGDYYHFLMKVGYAKDSTYIKKLKQIK